MKAKIKKFLLNYRNAIGYARARPFGWWPSFKIYGPRDDHSVYSILASRFGFFERHVTRLLPKLLSTDAVVFDVGANIGALTCAFSHLSTKVYAFEASSTALTYLQRAVAENHLNNVSVVHRAVSDRSGQELSMAVNAEFLGGSYVTGENSLSGGTFERVVSTSLSDFCKEGHVDRLDLIKMDIEGFEIPALEGAVEIIRALKPKLLIECNAIALKRNTRGSVQDLYRILESLFSHVYIIPDFLNMKGLVPLSSVEDLLDSLRLGRGNEDLLCLHEAWNGPLTDMAEFKARLATENTRGQEVIIDPRFEISVDEYFALNATRGETLSIPVRVKNNSDQVWATQGRYPIFMSYHLLNKQGCALVFDGLRTELPRPLAANETQTINVQVYLPVDLPTDAVCKITALQEGIVWFDELGNDAIELLV